ncbi:MAG: metalloregulator ArsR/SmtB family transcription factor [Phenylobacterium sp.]|uniref:ArsR/SmtB family transcription factor n=1 Tax=Phenylobacterium sp. TaxID=1871053 RepID=UPI0025EE4B3F|nr:metalloregulator ArsR/SmtB family transcription factor [Phenylobacterium sp.]MBI1200188.1 metalloregulator ArsR/SmtB family transcription factor [Phenylobacterium sp.]
MEPADLFRTLADGTRRGLFERLTREGELSVGALTAGTGVSQPAVSQHLKALRLAGLVGETRQGRTVLYRARPEGLRPLVDWMGLYGRFWAERFDALEDLLARMDQ